MENRIKMIKTESELKDDKLSSCCEAPYRIIYEQGQIYTYNTCSVCHKNCTLTEPPKQETLEVNVHETIKLKDVPL